MLGESNRSGQVSDRLKLTSLSMLLNSSILAIGEVGLEDWISLSSCKRSGEGDRGLFLFTERGADWVGGRALVASSLRLFGLGIGRFATFLPAL